MVVESLCLWEENSSEDSYLTTLLTAFSHILEFSEFLNKWPSYIPLQRPTKCAFFFKQGEERSNILFKDII